MDDFHDSDSQTVNQIGALNSVGGMFAIAFCRELAPILTASIVAGQVGSPLPQKLAR